MSKVPAPSPPVVGGTPNVHSGKQTGFDLVVIHSAVIQCARGMARALGHMNQTSTTGSWHYAVDPFETIQCSWDSFVCWADGVNWRHIAIEMADFPGPVPQGKTKQQIRNLKKSWRWAGKNHRMMLHRTAYLTARLLLSEGLPLQYVGVAGLKAGKKGWTTHANVTDAFHKSTHWDPGFWPRLRFAQLVRRYGREIREKYEN